MDLGAFGTLFAALAPPGTVLAVGGYLAKRVVTHDVTIKAQDARLVRIEAQVDKLVDHLIEKP